MLYLLCKVHHFDAQIIMSTLPTLLFVPGLGHRPIHFKRMIDYFASIDWSAKCVDLPSMNPDEMITKRTFAADAKQTQNQLNLNV